VAVADICNTADAVAVKKSSSLLWYNLVEVLNLKDATLETALANYESVLQQHQTAGLNSCAYATCAVHGKCRHLCCTLNERSAGKLISVHNCETPAEDELFQNRRGAVFILVCLI
jgi:hypothetical protein